MPPQYWSRAWKTKPWIRRLSGLILEPSTADRGVTSWIASLAETRARTQALQASRQDLTEIDGLPNKSSGSSMRCGLLVSSARTSRGLPTSSLKPSSQHWSEWATALHADYSQRQNAAEPIDGSGFSSWPTATVESGAQTADNPTPGQTGGTTLEGAARRWPTIRACSGERSSGANRTELVNAWATPNVPNGGRVNPPGTSPTGMTPDGRKKQVGLENQAKQWPTARTSDTNGPGHHGDGGPDLRTMAAQWPTASARDWKSGEASDETMDRNAKPLNEIAYRFLPQDPTTPDGINSHLALFRRYRPMTNSKLKSEMRALLLMAVRNHGRGWTKRRPTRYVRPSFKVSLNPSFVEFLMNWPTGWTDCEHAVTGFSQWLRHSRGYLSMLCSRKPTQFSLF